jgi:hypothetical protein
MKIELGKNSGVKSPIALILFFVCYAIISQTGIYANGTQDGVKESANVKEPAVILEQTDQKQTQKILMWSEPAVRPDWVDTVRQSDTEFYFVGTSQIFNTPANARENARESARNQVLDYYGQVIEKQATALSSVSGSTRDTLTPYINREEEIRVFAQNVVSEVATVAYYTEMYLNSNNKEEYIVYTLHRINRQKAEEEISGFAKNISVRYTAAFSQWKTLKAALEGYALIAKTLERNPLHRIMAYYDTPKGRAGLYEYARIQINELANSISIEAIPARSIQETETLTTTVKLRSSIIPATGLLDCQASLFGGGGDNITLPFNTASDDPFVMYNRNLKPGSYNVTIEILLSDLTGGIAKNNGSSFTFEVTPLNVVLNSQDAIEAGIKRAVDTLAVRLKTQTETVIGTFMMTGKNTPSELSLFLSEKITHYAKENQARKYKVVEGETKNKAVLNGFFTKRNDRVDVTLELTTPDNASDGSQIFSLSLAVLEQIPLAVEPENIDKMINLPSSVAGTINIEARFNSSTLTYKHGDELKLTVTADKNCYFKIIHIDVENKIKMIYPRNKNDNNSLRANVSRNVFDNSAGRIIFCEPYGAETLVVVASSVQFPDIDKEYGQPWKAATEESIKKAVAGAGEARYTITILKPHEEYEYAKPQNIYQTIRDDTVKQGGYFEGGETSGYYIVDNIRGSYRVPSDKPDTIRFAAYFLDTYSGISGRGPRTRGKPYDFSFAVPQNISHAIQTVRSGIESKGGTFSGDEQQGNFRSSGIAGQYIVSDKVTVTISEKPFVVPNSLIENEVKNYFGVR